MMTMIEGPCVLPCEEKCEVPAGLVGEWTVAPRHAWPGVLVCPNRCGRAIIVTTYDPHTTDPREAA